MTESTGPATDRIADAYRDLGLDLAARREARAWTREELGSHICYSPGTVANVERGRVHVSDRFWENADDALAAGGALATAHDEVKQLARKLRAKGARKAQAAKPPRQQTIPAKRLLVTDDDLVVARWTGLEIRALREAMRLTGREFANRLGVAINTVTMWQSPVAPVLPTLAMQSVRDQALRIAPPDTRTRFRLLIDGHQDPPRP